VKRARVEEPIRRIERDAAPLNTLLSKKRGEDEQDEQEEDMAPNFMTAAKVFRYLSLLLVLVMPPLAFILLAFILASIDAHPGDWL
jgi:hypothetical protein